MNTPFQPEPGKEIRYTKVGRLGEGGQGDVDKVVDMHTGEHYACKVFRSKVIPQWGIFTPKQFKVKIEKEVDMLMKIRHNHIVPYLFTQGWLIDQNIEIFMPVYEGSLNDKISKLKSQEEKETKIETMFYQISLALDYVHTCNPPIIHRDVKPPNILYRGETFFLTDFGLAKVLDESRTEAGTSYYMAPEFREKIIQTPKVDIYALSATFLECLGALPRESERPITWHLWHQLLQNRAS